MPNTSPSSAIVITAFNHSPRQHQAMPTKAITAAWIEYLWHMSNTDKRNENWEWNVEEKDQLFWVQKGSNKQMTISHQQLLWMQPAPLFKTRGRYVGPPSLGNLALPQGTTEGCACCAITYEVERQLRGRYLITNVRYQKKVDQNSPINTDISHIRVPPL